MINWINVQKMVKVVSGNEGEGPPASRCQVLCGCHVAGPARTLTGGPYRCLSREDLAQGSYVTHMSCHPATRASSEPGVLPRPLPVPLLGEGPGMGTARPLPVGLQSQDERRRLPRTGRPRPADGGPASPDQAPPFERVPLAASVVLMLGGDISRTR